MKRLITLLLVGIALLILTACGGGGGDSGSGTPSQTPQEIAINKIKAYADDNTNSAPTLLTYKTADVVGVTLENIDDVNNVVASLIASDVDTTEEVQKIVDDLEINILPTVNAGSDKNIEVGNAVTITGTGTDSDGTITAYEWKKGGTVLADTASFAYAPTEVGTDTLTLTVTDNDGATSTDSMIVTVTVAPIPNNPPVSDAGANQSVPTGTTVTLDGSGSSDEDGDQLTYVWSITSKPDGSTAELSSVSVVSPTFVADIDGTYTIQLIVSDGVLSSALDAVTVIAMTPNTIPVADAGLDREMAKYSKAYLDGSGSNDVENDPLTYSWTLQKPSGSTATLSNATSVDPTFVADKDGDYIVTLIVNDGKSDSIPTIITLTASTQYWKIDGQNIVPTYEEQIPQVPAVPEN